MPSESPRNPAGAPQEPTSKGRRYLAAAALLGGGVTIGAVFSPIGFAGAQTANDTADADAVDSDSEQSDDVDRRLGHGPGHGHGHRHQLEELSELLGLSADELRAELEAGNSLADIANALGITNDELIAGMLAAVEERLDEAVAAGHIDEAAAAQRLARAEERIPELIERTPGDGFVHSHPHRHGHGHGHGFGEALEELGITTDELRAGREAGMTLAEVAAEQGVSEAALVDALVANAVEKVDAAVEAGRIDTERAEEIKGNADERIAELVNTEPGDRDGHPHRHRHPHRHGGHDGDAEGGDVETGLST